MKKARLIKKADLVEQEAPRVRQGRTPGQTLANVTQKTLARWVRAQQNSRNQNPRAAFAALFTAEA
jgi:hypothetical protein